VYSGAAALHNFIGGIKLVHVQPSVEAQTELNSTIAMAVLGYWHYLATGSTWLLALPGYWQYLATGSTWLLALCVLTLMLKVTSKAFIS